MRIASYNRMNSVLRASLGLRVCPLSSLGPWTPFAAPRWRLYSSATDGTLLPTLASLPEYKQGSESLMRGQFAQAATLLDRAIQVLDGSVGPTSELTLRAKVERVKALVHNGDDAKAHAILTDATNQLQKEGAGRSDASRCWEVHVGQWAALLQLHFWRQRGASNNVGDACVDALTTVDPQDLALFSPAYGLSGLSLLRRGELDDATDTLQVGDLILNYQDQPPRP